MAEEVNDEVVVKLPWGTVATGLAKLKLKALKFTISAFGCTL